MKTQQEKNRIVTQVDVALRDDIASEFIDAASMLYVRAHHVEVTFPPPIDDFQPSGIATIQISATVIVHQNSGAIGLQPLDDDFHSHMGTRVAFELGTTTLEEILFAVRKSVWFYIMANQHPAAKHINYSLMLFRNYPSEPDLLIASWKHHASTLMHQSVSIPEDAERSDNGKVRAYMASAAKIRESVNRYILGKTKDWLPRERERIIRDYSNE